MQKGMIKYMNNGFYYNFDEQELIPAMELWKPITDKSVPGVRPFYWVSDLGRIFNTNTNRFVPQYDDANRGYLLITLATDHGNVTKSIHRIVMIEFVGFDPDPIKDEVDHRSGVKYNNSIYNLHWVSGSENVIAAYDNGLMPSGEDSPISILRNVDAHKVCEMMQEGVDREIIYDFLRSRGIKSPGSVFNSIYTRKTWKRISKDYVFKDYKERNTVFEESQIHDICKCLEKNMNHKDIISYLGYNPESMTQSERNNMYTAISHIKKGWHYIEISSKYNIDRNSSKQVFTDEEIHYICKRLEEHASTKQILHELGYDVNIKEDYHRYYHYMNPIGKIKQRKMFTHISSKYNF